MEKLFRQFLDTYQISDFNDSILLAVSGGVDSVVMTHLFAETDLKCAIAHCNFQLRPGDSEADEAFVRELAASLEMPVHIRACNVVEEMKESGSSLQMAARDLRYRWFEELAKEKGYTAIATAHNLNDSVETFLLNLGRGTGLRGLGGIPEKKGRIIRPLLSSPRAGIEAYAKKKRIAFREDLSNHENKYQRNKIRLDVIPHMESINPAFIECMSGNMQRIREARLLLDETIRKQRETLFVQEGDQISVDIKSLKALSPRGTWIYELFSPYGFSRQQCEGIRHILDAGSGKRSISPSHQVYKDRDRLIVAENRHEGFRRYYLDSPEHVSSLPFGIDVELVSPEDLGPIPTEASVACLDLDKVQFPLTIRHWQAGDYFYPLGMQQMKKLSDFFIDEKVPMPEKERTWILACGKKIVWIMGRRIDNRFRITEDTQKVLLLRLHTDVGP